MMVTYGNSARILGTRNGIRKKIHVEINTSQIGLDNSWLFRSNYLGFVKSHNFADEKSWEATTVWDWSPKLEGNSMTIFLGDRTGRTAKIFGRNKGKLQIWWFHTKFCGCFWYLYFSVVPFGELFDDDVWHFKYLISGYGVRSCEICPMFFEDLEQNKTDLYRSGAVLEQRRWEWENFGWGWKEVKQSGDSKTASRISRLWVDHSRKMSLLAYLAVDPSLSDRSFVTDPFQALTSGARVACGTCRWLTSTESTTSLRGQEILRWALPAVALLVGLFVEHAARAELMPLWSSLFVHFL